MGEGSSRFLDTQRGFEVLRDEGGHLCHPPRIILSLIGKSQRWDLCTCDMMHYLIEIINLFI